MAKVVHTCTGCVPIDASIIDTYVALVDINDKSRKAEDERNSAEAERISAEAERERVFSSDHERAENDHTVAASDHSAAVADHADATEDHRLAVEDHSTATSDHSESVAATARASAAAAAAEHMVDIHTGPEGPKGSDGDAAGFGDVTASIDDSTGYPTVNVVASGDNKAKDFAFSFSGLKGADGAVGPAGVTSAVVTVDNTSGIPTARVTLENQVLTFNFTGLKGGQGNSGYSGAAGELQIVNNLTDGGETAALSAEMGKQLGEGKVSNVSSNLSGLGLSCIGDNVDLHIADNDIDLDTIVYDGKSLRTIFETNNTISFSPGFEDGTWGTYTINSGTPTIQSSEKDSGNYALMASGTTSQQIISPATATGRAFMASRVKITSWTSGYCGIQYGNDNDSHDGGVSGITNGWVTVVGEKSNTTSYRVYIGSFSSANLTGYVDTPVIVFKSTFETVPSKEVFTALYDKYCSIKRGDPVSGFRTLKLCVDNPKSQPSASDCKAAFVAAMNEKAAYIGATTAVFMDASGQTYSGSAASAKDFLQIMVHASGIRGIAEKWSRNTYDMTILGDNSRTESITTSVANENYDETSYPILGGKTGTITATGNVNYNLAWIAYIGGVECACVLMGDNTDNKRWNDAEAIVEYLEDVLAGESPTLSVNAPCVAACKLPANPIMYDNFSFELLASKNPTTTRIPASLTKIMSLILAYDYITDENETIKIVSSDIIGGSGDNILDGDIVSIRDLVYDMLLPSSNDAATALARYVGAKILGY